MSSYDNIIYYVENILIFNNNMEDSTDSVLRDIITLSSETLKYALFRLGGDIRYFTNQKKQTVTVDIERRWINDIIEQG